MKMKNAIELAIPSKTDRFTLETDASDSGMGGILNQKESPIVCFSGKFTPAQRKYSITERELYAALWGIEKCRNYLWGREFDLITDHKAIESYFKKNEFGNARIGRWYDRLEAFKFVQKYRPGDSLASVDASSRSLLIATDGVINKVTESLERKIQNLHEKFGHRKCILKDV